MLAKCVRADRGRIITFAPYPYEASDANLLFGENYPQPMLNIYTACLYKQQDIRRT